MLTAKAIETVKSTEEEKLQATFLNLPQYEGLIKTDNKPFSLVVTRQLKES